MSINYKELLRLAYEMEGLLLVQMDRPERHSKELDLLIAEKAAAFNSLITEDTKDVVDQSAIATSALEEEKKDADIIVPAPMRVESSVPARQANNQEPSEATSASQAVIVASEPAPTLDERIARDRAKDIFKAFTLNDKFRFKRELFRNSQAEFDETLNVISAMNSLAEAEEYFYEDLCWDASNEDVKAFMEVVAKHF